VPKNAPIGQIECVLHVGLDNIPIGEIAFELHVTEAHATERTLSDALAVPTFVSMHQAPPTTKAAEPVGTSADHYRTAFVSYARADFREVSFFAQGLSEKGIKPCVDISQLEPGEEWEKELQPQIGRADVFYLMWSDNAARSKYVDWESRHAVELYGQNQQPRRPRIKPIPLHQPWPTPPQYLQPFHFYSVWQAHRAAQAAGLTKPEGAG